ncbi:nuclear transport factor 2 family protein [Flavobacterium sp. RHBU_3]|uniref:nuclear transport factor 2 family protein n=1 Tax=Flavobacterium sp. RHBU_3 TaxID=3391184 RepID=UPI003984BE41
METRETIAVLDSRLVEAMKTSNVAELDLLLSDTLIFTNQFGHLVTKADDLAMHRDGKLEIYSLEVSAQLIMVEGDVAVVSTVQDVSGSSDGHAYTGIYRYTRVWKQFTDGWKVIAGHISQIIS